MSEILSEEAAGFSEAAAEPVELVEPEPVLEPVPDFSEEITSFDALGLSDVVKKGLEGRFTRPTVLQARVIPQALLGHDMWISVAPGSGKACAFGLPILEKLEALAGQVVSSEETRPEISPETSEEIGEQTPQQEQPRALPQALIVCPNREMTHHVAEVLRAVGAPKGLKVAAFYGGTPLRRQMALLRHGVDVAVGTPARIWDHLRRRSMTLEGVKFFVINQADTMLAMGAWRDITELAARVPKERQTLLFAASSPREVVSFASTMMREPVRMHIGISEKSSVVMSDFDHVRVKLAPDVPRELALLNTLETLAPEGALVYCNTRFDAQTLASYLSQAGYLSKAMWGILRPASRQAFVESLRAKKWRCVVATEGAHVPVPEGFRWSCVVHADIPEDADVYHYRLDGLPETPSSSQPRIRVVSVVAADEEPKASLLQESLGFAWIEHTEPALEEVNRLRSQRMKQELIEKAVGVDVTLQMPVAQELLGSPEASNVVAFLLKNYYAQQSDEGRSRPLRSHGQAHGQARRRATDGGHGPHADGAQQHSAESERQHEGRPEASRDGAPERGGRFQERRRGGRFQDRRRSGGGGGGGGRGEQRAAGDSGYGHGGGRRSYPNEHAGRQTMSDNFGMEMVDAADLLATDGPSGANHTAPLRASEPIADGSTRIRVNIGFDDGFKGRGSVAKKIASLAGLNETSLVELESRRDYAVLKAASNVASLILDRVDGAQVGKKVISVELG